jgi:hypothetical protein
VVGVAKVCEGVCCPLLRGRGSPTTTLPGPYTLLLLATAAIQMTRESPFNDLIIGTRSADDILADFPGVNNDRDRVEAAQGNDEIHVRDGDARDTVDCGKGRDEVWANRHDDIANNCERVRYN